MPKGEEFQLVGQVVAGGIAGGVVSQIYGGNFWQGFAQGATTAATAFLFNQFIHGPRKQQECWRFKEQVVYGWGIGKDFLFNVMCVYEQGYYEYSQVSGTTWRAIDPPVQGYLKVQDLWSCPAFADPKSITIFPWVKNPPPGYNK